MSYLTVQKPADGTWQGYYEEKKSRFLSFLMPVASEEEAKAELDKIKKKYWDARHYVYAYRVGGENPREKFSDDAEPAQTAGLPTMTVLKGAGLSDCLLVTVRYFGGTLLGTGGLVRAYTSAAKDAVANAQILEIKEMVTRSVVCPYPLWDTFVYKLGQIHLKPEEVSYTDAVQCQITMEKAAEGDFQEILTGLGLA